MFANFARFARFARFASQRRPDSEPIQWDVAPLTRPGEPEWDVTQHEAAPEITQLPDAQRQIRDSGPYEEEIVPLGLPDKRVRAHMQETMHDMPPEPATSTDAFVPGYGLDAMHPVFVSEIADLLETPSTITINNAALGRLKVLLGMYAYELLPRAVFQGDGEMTIVLRLAASLYKENTLDHIASVDIPLMVLFALSFPVLLVSFLVLRPLEHQIRQENIRTMKMLLMVPGSVISKVPALVEDLDTGKQENAQQKLKDALDEYVARNESILSASVDGIVVANAAKEIEMFSPAAQAIFGYAEDEVKDKSVNVLLPASVAEHHDQYMDEAISNGRLSTGTRHKLRELTGRRKDGSLFPVLVSLTILKINEKVLISSFIRDISSQKQSDAALRKEKEKSEKLLQALLPGVIAQQLKEDGVNAAGSAR
eukprot:TRINITY_DN435_c1_g2_i2.p1 TRINITY_DN435_c1_g2~~TRINITY_DN435_c1_g2_i2.p1  ORF type:complete len:425 (-),score=115.80 TRINITY_DN435_c1_g2_i2:513-1787(-)